MLTYEIASLKKARKDNTILKFRKTITIASPLQF